SLFIIHYSLFMPQISIIIPTLNEEKNIGQLIQWLRNTVADFEIIVVDGGSKDNTIKVIESFNEKIIHSFKKNRAVQLNLGAANAKSDLLYFVHADVLPPENWFSEIMNSLNRGEVVGCFSYKFDPENAITRIHAKATKRNSIFTGGGDQTLFIKKEIFKELNGFKESLELMEDFDLVWRIKRKYPFVVLASDAIVSSRKHKKSSYLWVQIVNLFTIILFSLGFKNKRLKKIYQFLVFYS
ncbi:MAG: TIGR04283 family arsenosugar biosynthesis glycosyltransferase, partial [Saprospiraceae bacterium]